MLENKREADGTTVPSPSHQLHLLLSSETYLLSGEPVPYDKPIFMRKGQVIDIGV